MNQMDKTKYTYDEALKASMDYYGGDELAAKVFVDKYALRDGEDNILEKTPTDMHWRIANEFARVEKAKFGAKALSADTIFGYLDRFKWIIPQGSQMFGIGNNYQTISLSNCYVVSTPQDSYGSILKSDEQLAQISKRRGGVGVDLSNLRPSGAAVKNAARTSTGITSWMERYSNTIREVGQSGRRGALMLTLDITHPQAEDFATVKNDPTKVTGANISLRLTDKFMKAVENDEEFEQRWPINVKHPKIVQKVSARALWKKIIHSAWFRAEPGLLFWDKVKEYNAVDCYSKFGFETVSTNPCSELPLCEFDSCRLLVVNLYSFVTNPFTKDADFDFARFKQVVKVAQRLMDDVIDLELEKIEDIINKIKADPEADDIKREELAIWIKIKEKCTNGRRTGLGIVGMADMLAALQINYGSSYSIDVVEKVQKTLKLHSYEASMELARDLGPFPIWDWELEKDSKFLLQIKKESPELYDNIAKYGRRNIANLTIAPTGSVAIVAQVSSGIEPLFALEPYIRRKKVNPSDKNAKVDFTDALGDKWQEFEVYHPKVKTWMEITGEKDWKKSPWFNCCAKDINWVRRVELQAAAQRHIDHAISSTLNLPNNVSVEKVAEIYETAWKAGCKGITVYRDGCRSGVMVEKPTPATKAKGIPRTVAPVRPSTLQCEVFHTVVKGVPHYVVVGLVEGQPYEVFTGLNTDKKDVVFIPKNMAAGVISKLARGKYALHAPDVDPKTSEDIWVLNNGHSNDDVDALSRIISCALRHGSDISFVVQQLEKTKGDMFSFSKAISRVLKKYIPNGTKVHGANCPECQQDSLKRESGCVTCSNCGWSKCG